MSNLRWTRIFLQVSCRVRCGAASPLRVRPSDPPGRAPPAWTGDAFLGVQEDRTAQLESSRAARLLGLLVPQTAAQEDRLAHAGARAQVSGRRNPRAQVSGRRNPPCTGERPEESPLHRWAAGGIPCTGERPEESPLHRWAARGIPPSQVRVWRSPPCTGERPEESQTGFFMYFSDESKQAVEMIPFVLLKKCKMVNMSAPTYVVSSSLISNRYSLAMSLKKSRGWNGYRSFSFPLRNTIPMSYQWQQLFITVSINQDVNVNVSM